MVTKKKMTKQELEERYSDVLNDYFYRRDFNKPNKLERLVDKILVKLRFVNVDNEDFYSLANEIFVDVLERYDGKQDFNGFLYSCLCNKFKTEMTRRNREKRKADKMAISWETPIGDDDGGTIGDLISNGETIETEVFEQTEDSYSKTMNRYLNRLSKLQKEVLRFLSIGFSTQEIIEELHISEEQFQDCYRAITSPRNKNVLLNGGI